MVDRRVGRKVMARKGWKDKSGCKGKEIGWKRWEGIKRWQGNFGRDGRVIKVSS